MNDYDKGNLAGFLNYLRTEKDQVPLKVSINKISEFLILNERNY